MPITCAPRLLEVRDGLGERVRLQRAALREGLGEEVQHDRPLLQRLLQVEVEVLARQRALGGDLRGLGALLQGGGTGHGGE
jgi:hypothetical protein